MARRQIRFRIDPTGALEVIDPDTLALELLAEIDPSSIHERRTGHAASHFCTTSAIAVPLTRSNLKEVTTEQLWRVHDEALKAPKHGAGPQSVSVLAVKVELARRELMHCRLCRHRCGINRIDGELGRCGLGREAVVAEHFVHVAEEDTFNPAYVLNLRGCALRCRYCQQHALLSPAGPGHALTPSLWSDIDLEGARSLEFVGGNPDESVHAALRFLERAPSSFTLPIVWNCHGYAEPVLYRLLRGVVDVYVPDFKYWDDGCARKWSGVDGYHDAACAGLESMLLQDAQVIVRVLVLPGHSECCHLPTLRWLARFGSRLSVHILDQYAPDFRIVSSDGLMAFRPSSRELNRIVQAARKLGLQL